MGSYSSTTISYSNLEGGWEGEGNIDSDPLFTNSENGIYTLQEGSPCIDTGTPDIDSGNHYADIPDYCGTAPEMGAYEYCAGCTDELACNYDEESNVDDGSCLYPEDIFDCCVCDCEGTLPEINYDCDGNCIVEIDECGICGGNNECLSLNELIIPDYYSISNIYPNPFNPVTNITYGLPENGNVLLNIYNIQGRLIETLLNDFQTAGYHSLSWDASSHPSGVYLVRMESGEFTQTQKVLLVK